MAGKLASHIGFVSCEVRLLFFKVFNVFCTSKEVCTLLKVNFLFF